MKRKQTKIVATLAAEKIDREMILSLYNAGMDVVRLNTAHMPLETAKASVKKIRSVSDNIAILLDTKGPEVRTTYLETPLSLKEGDEVLLCDGTGDTDQLSDRDHVYVNYNNFVRDVPVGSRVLIDDGVLAMKVEKKAKDGLVCRIENEGKLESRKSVNVPGVTINVPSLSDRDRQFIEFAVEENIEFIAHSFVRKKEDVEAVQTILDLYNSPIKIIAKIENQEGVDKIDEILECVYGIMVARGDLGIEIAAEKIPGIQKRLMSRAISKRKPVIVATQMLHSMISNPRPTRAEVTDVANAIFEGTDAVMLSGETAYGQYPLEAVQTMASIAREVEANLACQMNLPDAILTSETAAYLTKSAVMAAEELDTTAIVADSLSGRTILGLSAYRPRQPIYAICYDEKTMRELALSFGVYAHHIAPRNTTDEFLYEALTYLNDSELVDKDDLVVVLAGNFGRSQGASYIEVCPVNKLLQLQTHYRSQRLQKESTSEKKKSSK